MINNDFINSLTKKSDLLPDHIREPEPHHSDRIPILDQGVQPRQRPNPAIPVSIKLDRPELEWLIKRSKIPSFFSFIPDSKRKSLIKGHYIHKDFVVLSLDLDFDELEIIRKELDLWKKVLEAFLFFFNHMSASFFPNITFSPVIINGNKKINSCIVLFKWKTPSWKTWKWYREFSSFCLNITNKQKDETEPTNKPPEPVYDSDEECIYFEIQKMLEEKNISVRKIFALWMKQRFARSIYSRIMELGLFEIDTGNQNEKVYHQEKFGSLTQEIITEILSMENPEN